MKILYITTNFEAVTHTFITREVEKVRQAGNKVELLALRRIDDKLKSTQPECDLSGCRFIYPVGFGAVFSSALRCLFTRPRRFVGTVKNATSGSSDSLKIRIKLIYQVMVATTQLGWFESQNFEHIHAHFASPPTSFAMHLHFLTGVPFSFTGHGADVFRDTSALDKKIATSAGVVCISEYNRRHYKTLVPELPQTAIVHCGINLDKFTRRTKKECSSTIAILAVGRCVPKKGFGDLLKALKELDTMGIEWTANIAGHGPLLLDLQQTASDIGIADRLNFLGSVPQKEITRLLNVADVFILPSVPVADGDIDGIPVSLMEAMAVGCPVISTEVSGIPELISDRKSGLLVKPHDPSGLAKAIKQLRETPDLYEGVSDGGRAKVEAEFDLTSVGEQLTAFFSRIAVNVSNKK